MSFCQSEGRISPPLLPVIPLPKLTKGSLTMNGILTLELRITTTGLCPGNCHQMQSSRILSLYCKTSQAEAVVDDLSAINELKVLLRQENPAVLHDMSAANKGVTSPLHESRLL